MKKFVLGNLLCVLVSCSALAKNSLLDVLPSPYLRPYFITISAGPAWASAGQTQTFLFQPQRLKTYNAIHNTSSLSVGEIYMGWQSRLRTMYYGQLGLAVAESGAATLSGDVWHDIRPLIHNNYTYDINQWRLTLKGKLLQQEPITRLCVLPYISAGIGFSFNNAYNYRETFKVSRRADSEEFINNSMTSYAATLGIGFQRHVSKNWQAGIGYEFADWGESQLGLAPAQTMNTGLVLTHLYTHGLMFNLSYVAG